MGFDKIPTVHEYVHELIKQQNIYKISESEDNDILQLENIKKNLYLRKFLISFLMNIDR